MSKVKVDIDKLIDGYYESDIHRYYSKHGKNAEGYAKLRLWSTSPDGNKIRRASAKNAGKKAVEKKLGFHGFSDEQRRKVGLRNGYRNMELGIGLTARTPEKRKQDAIKGGTVSGNKNKGKFLIEYNKNNPESQSNGGKIGGRKNVESGHIKWLNETYAKENSKYFDHDKRLCNKCGRVIKGLGMYSLHHGDNCKYLDKINKQKEILSSLPTEFNSNDVARICKELNFNRKTIKYGICKDDRYIEVLHEGTNQHNPSIFKKLF